MTNIKNNEAQKFYTKILPKRLENVKKNFKGTPEELKEVLEDMEEDLTAEFWDDLDKKIEQEKENLENKYKIHRQDMNLQKEGSQTLATEIICDQKKEIEKLKAELQREKARHRKPEYITEYRKIIMETVDKIQNEQIQRDQEDGISTKGGNITLNELFEIYMSTKSNICFLQDLFA